MSENHSGLSAPRPKRTITASSKLVDPQNTAEPIRSHKRAIELKRVADSELANKQHVDAANHPFGSGPSRNQLSLSTLLEPRTSTNQSYIITDKVGSSSDLENHDSEDEPIERCKSW
jgi:hypothetical protein